MSLDDPPKARRNPRALPPDRDPSLRPNARPGASLVEELGEVVDDARQLLTDFGLRPYRVFSMVVRWSGGEVGKGNPCVVSETELLPTPKVSPEGLEQRMTSGGESERGIVKMTGVSPRYTEDDVRSLFHVQPLPAGLEGYLEVRVDARDGATICRRFLPLVPSRRPGKFDWIVPLRRQNQNERRDLTPPNVPAPHEVDARRRGSW